MAKKLIALLLCLTLLCALSAECFAANCRECPCANCPCANCFAGQPESANYELKQVVVLSRHNIRSPLSEKGSVLDEITPHEWFTWTSNPGELSLRGAMLETTMGQYFRLWLEDEGLFPENYLPKDGAVRFYANGLQRTQATAHYFSTGLLPVCVVPVERHVDYNTVDGVFVPVLTFMNGAYEADLRAEIAERGGGEGLSGYSASLHDAIRLLMDVADVEESEAYQSGAYGNLLEDETVLNLVEGKEASLSGPIKTATSVADGLVLQYYEEPDELKAAFGHELSLEDWKTIGTILATYEDILFGSPSLAVNVANPMLRELFAELNAQGRQFSFLCGHDSTITSVLAALGVEDYELPNAIEPTTPIGSKVVFQRWVNEDGDSFFKVELVYQSVDQLRSIQPLSLEVPPMIVPLSFKGVPVNADGMIPEKDLMNLFLDKISMMSELEEVYTAEEQVLPAAA
ncbi:MAG: histidine-type phosphatase [Oscillospiraceae bacterium]|nr:histidine-type phosphatase [Oscillospiraceae bacterium]